MSSSTLCYSREIGYVRLFTEMPSYHYMDESKILLSVANDDIPDTDKIRIAVKVTI